MWKSIRCKRMECVSPILLSICHVILKFPPKISLYFSVLCQGGRKIQSVPIENSLDRSVSWVLGCRPRTDQCWVPFAAPWACRCRSVCRMRYESDELPAGWKNYCPKLESVSRFTPLSSTIVRRTNTANLACRTLTWIPENSMNCWRRITNNWQISTNLSFFVIFKLTSVLSLIPECFSRFHSL